MPVTGKAKRDRRGYMRDYMRRKRAEAKGEHPPSGVTPREMRVVNALATGEARSVRQALIQAGFSPSADSIRDRLKPGGDLAKHLRERCEANGLSVDKTVRVIAESLDATKPVRVLGANGEETTTAPAWDTRLEGARLAIPTLERAGAIPAAQQGPAGGLSITLVEVHYGEVRLLDVVGGGAAVVEAEEQAR